MANKIIQDHLGNTYDSIESLCKAYNIASTTLRYRLNRGWSLKDALTKEKKSNGKGKAVQDHLGNKYGSTKDLCKAYNINYTTFMVRIENGWSMEDAITKEIQTPEKGKAIQDHLGNTYESVKSLCKAYNIDITTFTTRLDRGWSIEDALTKEKQSNRKAIQDHIGNTYDSITDLCKAYNIRPDTFKDRIRRN